jgi:release factor glutamine methyltransferase
VSLNLLQAWQTAKGRLEAAGLAGPVIDARLLVEAAAEVTRADIVGDPYRPLTAEQETRLDDYLTRREHREPVSHILGRKGFWKIMLSVTPNVLTPRPESPKSATTSRAWPWTADPMGCPLTESWRRRSCGC